MTRIERALGILLLLREGKRCSAQELAQHFEVSTRTIYRDLDALSELGIPVYAEMGREGGYRLLDGYFMAPLMFNRGEAASLLLGLALLQQLRVQPFPEDLERARSKLLAALPDPLRNLLLQVPQRIGFEELPPDLLHWGPKAQTGSNSTDSQTARSLEAEVVGTFLRAILENKVVQIRYKSPYRAQSSQAQLLPLGILWDRDWWYLVGQRLDREEELRLWRADRVLQIESERINPKAQSEFNVARILGRTWLKEAMSKWSVEAPVKLRLTPAQATLLQQDWYYRHATFLHESDGSVMMCFGEDNPEFVLDLVRWLGPGAELLTPVSWRQRLHEELQSMIKMYE